MENGARDGREHTHTHGLKTIVKASVFIFNNISYIVTAKGNKKKFPCFVP
jgi:hypothetical protein